MRSASDCFKKLKSKCSVTKELYEYADALEEFSTLKRTIGSSQIRADVPPRFIEADEALRMLKPLARRFSIFKSLPETFYGLHTDSSRDSAINMELNSSDAVCFFVAGKEKEMDRVKVHVLNYEPSSMYIFNTQVNHAVLNRGTTRYILSVGLNCGFDEAVTALADQLEG